MRRVEVAFCRNTKALQGGSNKGKTRPSYDFLPPIPHPIDTIEKAGLGGKSVVEAA